MTTATVDDLKALRVLFAQTPKRKQWRSIAQGGK